MKKISLLIGVLLATAVPCFAQSTMSSSAPPPKPGLMAKMKMMAMKHKGMMSSTAPGSKMSLMDKIKAKKAMMSHMSPSGAMSTPMQSGSAPVSGTMSSPTSTPMSSMSGKMMSGGGSGKVWVNLSDGVYHYPGDRYYGKTKKGEYLSESAAMSAGYRAAGKKK